MGMMLIACNKDVPVKSDFPGVENYARVYMPQATRNPVENRFSITDKPDTITYSAFLGGFSPAANDVPVSFSVLPTAVDAYNLAHGTDFTMMPEGSYALEMPAAVIGAGQSSTGALNLIIKSKGFIEPFKTYMLAVTVNDAGGKANVNETLKTTYFLITGSYAPGEVPREKAASFGATGGNFLIGFNDKLIRRDPATGNLLLYKPDAAGVYNTTPVNIATGWDAFNLGFYYGGNRLIARNKDGGQDILQFGIDANGNLGQGVTVGFGWGIFSKIVPYKGLLLGIDGAGNMTKYPLKEDGSFDYGNIAGIGAGWNTFVNIFPYGDALIAIEANGDMWRYPLTENGAFGDRTKVGSGWDMYVNVIPSGTDLLGQDAQGDLWRYKFNPNGLWPLK